MIRRVAFAVLASFATAVLGEPIEVSCYWDAPSTHQTEPTGELAKFFGKPHESAYFRFDTEARSVTHNDSSKTQSFVLPTLFSLGATKKGVTITAIPHPTLVSGRNSILEIYIDRYTLTSTMILATANADNKGRYGQWLREGQCKLRQF